MGNVQIYPSKLTTKRAPKWVAIFGTMLSVSGCHDKPMPNQIEKYCVSDSGLSKYWLTLNTSEPRGTIRYQYMGQDARYVVKDMRIDGRKLSGRADFQSSTTGETRGNSIIFSYDGTADTLEDGAVWATCQNRQASVQA